MKKIITLTVLFITFFISSTIAQQKKQKIIVVDYTTKEPLEAAIIKPQNGDAVITNDKGEVEITNNGLAFTISHIGYTSMVQVIAANSNIVQLQKGAVNLQDVVLKNNTSPFKTISKIDLNTRPAKSSQELLRIVPGLFIAQHQGGGKAEQIFLRGFDIDHGTDIALSVDGLPVNMVSHAHGQGYADLHFVIPELVNKIDFGTGAYYANVGNFNTAGYVNFETVNKLDKSRVQLEVGQFNTARLLTMLDLSNKKNNRANGYVAGEFLYSDGPFISQQNFNRFNIFSKYNYKLSSNAEFSFLASAFNSRWDASGQVPDRAIKDGTISRFGSIDDTEGGYTSRYNVSATAKTLVGANTTIKQQLYFSNYKFNLFSNFTFFLNDPINGDQIKQRENRNILGYNGSVSFQNKINNAMLNTQFGIGFRNDNTFNSELSHTKNKVELLEAIKLGNINETNAFAYADEKITINKLNFNIGVRADYFNNKYTDKLNPILPSQSQAIISPKVNVQYSASKAIQLYVKWGKGFHSNDTRVVVENNGREILPASYGYDLGVTLKPFKNLFINAAYWKLNLEQEFVYVGDEGVIEPSGKTRRTGVDLSIRYQLSKKLFFDINYNTAIAKSIDNPKGQDYIPLAPTLTSIGGVTYKGNKEWSGSLRYRYMKSRAANEDNSVIAKGYFIADAAINYTKPKYELGIVVENVFNTKWNEAQFNTTSRLKNEPTEVTELHYTPGVPFFAKVKVAWFF